MCDNCKKDTNTSNVAWGKYNHKIYHQKLCMGCMKELWNQIKYMVEIGKFHFEISE